MSEKETSVSWERQVGETFGAAVAVLAPFAKRAEPLFELVRRKWEREVLIPAKVGIYDKANAVRRRTMQFFRR